MARAIMYLVAMAWGFGLASPVAAQVGGPGGVPDSIPIPSWDYAHHYDGAVRGNVTRVSMKNEYNGTLKFGSNITSSTILGIEKVAYRLQDRREDSKNFRSGLNWQLMPLVSANVSISDNRFFNRVVTISNATQDFKNNVKRAQGGLTALRLISPSFSVDGGAQVSVSRSEQSFLTQDSREGMVNGQAKLSMGKMVRFVGRGMLRKSNEEALVGDVRNPGLGLDEDSLSAFVKVNLSPTSDIRAEYKHHTKTNEFMDLPRGGVFLEQQFTGDLKRELETRTGEAITIKAQLTPMTRTKMNLEAEHSENVTDFAIEKRRFNRRVVDRIKANLSHNLGPQAKVGVNLERAEALNDLGPQSLGSFNEERRTAKLTFDDSLMQTVDVQIQAGAALIQTFFVDGDVNPRDRDQLDQFANLKVTATPFPKFKAGFYLAVNKTDYINIDGSLSSTNRAETTYNIRPDFTFTLNERIQIVQSYGLNIEFTDFVFTRDDNFLDRNVTFSNTFRIKLTPALSTNIRYDLLLHDRGSYLEPFPGAERLLDINQKDRRDQMSIAFRYRINSHLTLVGENDYSQRSDQIFGGPAFIDGGVEIGVEGAYKWGTEKTLNLKLIKVNRFGQFNSDLQRDYWMMDGSIKYAF